MTETVTTAAPAATAPVAAARSAGTARRIRRGAALVASLVLNAVISLIGTGLGADYLTTDPTGSAVVDLPTVVVFTGIFGLLGWGLLAVLERFTRRARTAWTVVAVLVTLASLIPIFLVDASVATRVALTVLHLAPAAVIIPVFRRAA